MKRGRSKSPNSHHLNLHRAHSRNEHPSLSHSHDPPVQKRQRLNPMAGPYRMNAPTQVRPPLPSGTSLSSSAPSSSSSSSASSISQTPSQQLSGRPLSSKTPVSGIVDIFGDHERHELKTNLAVLSSEGPSSGTTGTAAGSASRFVLPPHSGTGSRGRGRGKIKRPWDDSFFTDPSKRRDLNGILHVGGGDTSTLFVPPSSLRLMKPLERQYWEVKSLHFDSLVLLRCGSFYEMFELDGEIGVRDFGLTWNGRLARCGFPAGRKEFWVRQFLGAGKKVVVVEEVEEAQGSERKGKERKIREVLTPGTTVDSRLFPMNDVNAGILLVLVEGTRHSLGTESGSGAIQGRSYAFVLFDASRFKVRFGASFVDDIQATGMQTVLHQISPGEVLLLKKDVPQPQEEDSLEDDGVVRRRVGRFWSREDPINDAQVSKITRATLRNTRFPISLVRKQQIQEFLRKLSEARTQSSTTLPPSTTNSVQDWRAGMRHESRMEQLIASVCETDPLLMQALGMGMSYQETACLLRSFVLKDDWEFYPTWRQMLPGGTRHRHQVGANADADGDVVMKDVPTEMLLIGQTIENLELLRNLDDRRTAGSLFWFLNHCRTVFGKDRLRKWLLHPLFDAVALERRWGVLALMTQQPEIVRRFDDHFRSKKLSDLKKDLGYLFHHANSGTTVRSADGVYAPALVKRLRSLLKGFKVISAFVASIRSDFPNFFGDGNALPETCTISSENGHPVQVRMFEKLEIFVNQRCSTFTIDENGTLSPLTSEFDVLQAALEREMQKARAILENLRIRMNIPPPRRGTRMSKALFDLTLNPKKNPYRTVIPSDELVVIRSRRVNHTISTVQLQKLASSHELILNKMAELSDKCFLEVMSTLFDEAQWLNQCVDAIAEVDCYVSLYEVATNPQHEFCRPEIVSSSSPCLEIINCWHPVARTFVEQRGGSYVMNDVFLGVESSRPTFAIVTGKSTMLRAVCICIILAQIGSYVPARLMRFTLCDRLFTRIGANDRIVKGESTFMVEMSETSQIMNDSTSRSLVILDELGRGTSVVDGYSIALATTKYLSEKVGCLALFATHLSDLTLELEASPFVGRFKMDYTVDDDDLLDLGRRICPTFKMLRGICDNSFGIQVAQTAGIPPSVLTVARHISRETERRDRQTRSVGLNSDTLMMKRWFFRCFPYKNPFFDQTSKVQQDYRFAMRSPFWSTQSDEDEEDE